jgi:hypothetical protein
MVNLVLMLYHLRSKKRKKGSLGDDRDHEP